MICIWNTLTQKIRNTLKLKKKKKFVLLSRKKKAKKKKKFKLKSEKKKKNYNKTKHIASPTNYKGTTHGFSKKKKKKTNTEQTLNQKSLKA